MLINIWQINFSLIFVNVLSCLYPCKRMPVMRANHPAKFFIFSVKFISCCCSFYTQFCLSLANHIHSALTTPLNIRSQMLSTIGMSCKQSTRTHFPLQSKRHLVRLLRLLFSFPRKSFFIKDNRTFSHSFKDFLVY